VLTYTPEQRDEDDREKVLVRLTARALHELYIETKGLDVETRQMGHRAECDLCGEMVDFERAIPNGAGDPCHRRCWAEAYGALNGSPTTCSVNRQEMGVYSGDEPIFRTRG